MPPPIVILYKNDYENHKNYIKKASDSLEANMFKKLVFLFAIIGLAAATGDILKISHQKQKLLF